MKKLSFMLTLALLLPVSVSFAQSSLSATITSDASLRGVEASSAAQDRSSRRSAAASSSITVQDDARATGTEKKAERASAATDNSTGTTTASIHRSAVASLVQSLLGAADRDGGIGNEVRAVAQSQNESASTTAEAIQKVESRNAFKAFLIGTDWKNIGLIRAQIARDAADASRLQDALDRTTDVSLKAELQTELAKLNAEKANVQAFVDAHAKSFSVFGWFTKLFVSASTSAQ